MVREFRHAGKFEKALDIAKDMEREFNKNEKDKKTMAPILLAPIYEELSIIYEEYKKSLVEDKKSP